MNISKEQIKKITEKEITKSSNTKNITEEILNTSSIEELKLKINTTLKRANMFLSKQNISTNNNNLSDNTTSNIQNNNININTNNTNKEEENIPQKEIQNQIINNNKNIEEEKNNNTFNEEISSIERKKYPAKKQKLDPRLVLNLIEVIKFIIQRKIFVILYETYINLAIYQQYSTAFTYLVAICKHYPFKKLEEYYNYKTYNYAFRQLLRPFNRYNFKYFINCFQTKKKVEYLNILLTKMIKFKTLEKIYLYGQYIQEADEEKAFKIIIMKIMNTIIRPHLWEAFNIFRNNLYLEQEEKNNDNNDEEENLNSELSYDKNKEEKDISNDNNFIDKDNKDENEVNFNISDDENDNDEILSEKSFNNNKSNQRRLNIDNIEEKLCNNINNNKHNFNLNEIINSEKNKEDDISQSLDNKNQNKNEYIENDNDSDDININLNINNQRRKNDSSLKMNSYIYESLDSSQKSSLSIEPNSLDNDKLHKLKLILLEKNKNFENGLEDNYNIDEVYMGNSSKKSDKSLQELMNIKKVINQELFL